MSFIFAPAKLTLGFQVVGHRSDGYHLIDSEMTMVNFGDDIELGEVFEKNEERSSRIEVLDPNALGRYGFDFSQVPTGRDNLLDKVASIFHKSVDARIHKRIPVGGGLGGGSADAGALARLFVSIGYGNEDLILKLTKLGADIPVCFFGRRSKVGGIGEVVTFIDSDREASVGSSRRKFTLFLAPISVSTPEVYRAFDEGNSQKVISGDFSNDLEGSALALSPALRSFRATIEQRFAVTPSLAGSGSTYFVSGHVIDSISDGFPVLDAVSASQVHESRMIAFSDIYDNSVSYLALECVEIQESNGAFELS